MRQWPCQPSTAVLKKFFKPSGDIGKAIDAIMDGDKNATKIVEDVVALYDTEVKINQRVQIVNPGAGTRSKGRFPVPIMQYIHRRVLDGVDLLYRWKAAEEHEKHDVRAQDTESLQRSIGLLCKQTRAAIQSLSEINTTPIDRAAATWITAQLEKFYALLSGEDADKRINIRSAMNAEFSLLPPEAQIRLKGVITEEGQLRSEEKSDEALADLVLSKGVPLPKDALEMHLEKGSFRAAAEVILDYLELQTDTEIDTAIDRVEKTRQKDTQDTLDKVDSCVRTLRMTARFELDEPEALQRQGERLEDIARQLKEDLKTHVTELAPLSSDGKLEDLSDARDAVELALHQIRQSKERVRKAQITRLEGLKQDSPEQGKEIDHIISTLEDLTPSMAEDRIAAVRDGRSYIESPDVTAGYFEAFYPDFVSSASSEGWPTRKLEFAEMLPDQDGLLFVPEERRDASQRLMSAWYAAKGALGSQVRLDLKSLLRELGFQNASVSALSHDKVMRVYSGEVRAEISVRDGFLPPVFGSKSGNQFRLIVCGTDLLPEQIQPHISADQPSILVFKGVLSIAKRQSLTGRLRRMGAAVLIIDEAQVAFVATRGEDRMDVLVDCTSPFGCVEPYTSTARDVDVEMFFGREEEVQKIASHSNDGVLVYGGRQLGKTALLEYVQSRFDNTENHFIVVLDAINYIGSERGSAGKVWDRIGTLLKKRNVLTENQIRSRDDIFNGIENWLNEGMNRRILILLDECDEFLSSEAQTGFENLTRLKNLMEQTDRKFKVVFAGLHHVQRMFKTPNSPLRHFGDAICVGPLNRTQRDKNGAVRLIVEPLRAAGYKFESVDAPDRILAFVNYYPSLTQIFCKGLIDSLRRSRGTRDMGPLWVIPDKLLFQGETFDQIQNSINERFKWTVELDPRYQLVAYTLGHLRSQGRDIEVLIDGMTARNIRQETQHFWPKTLDQMTIEDMETILEELFELGILGKVKTQGQVAHYCLRTRQVANMLGTDDEIENELLKLGEIEPKVQHSRETYRPTFTVGTKKKTSPFTEAQMSRLVDPETGETGHLHVVAGLDFLGLKEVCSAIETFAQTVVLEKEALIEVKVAHSTKDIRANLDRSVPKKTTRVLVYHQTEKERDPIKSVASYIENAAKFISGEVRVIAVLNADNEEHRDFATSRSEDTIFLQPWGTEMLRSYLKLQEASHLDDKDSRSIVFDATGGIPEAIIDLVERGRSSASSLAKAAALTLIEELLPKGYSEHPTVRNRSIVTAVTEP